MEPKIVERPALTVVGVHYRGKNEHQEIPQLWQAFGSRAGEIEHIINPHIAYGISDNMDMDSGEFDYIAGFEVDSTGKVPAGMVSWEVAGGTYAVFTCTLSTLGDTYRQAYHVWLPEAGYEATGGADYEVYGEEFDPQDPEARFDVYIPVK